MTPAQLKEARRKLGLNLAQMAVMLGYETPTGKSQVQRMERGTREIMPAQRRLVELYLAGARPKDWPQSPNRAKAAASDSARR